MLATIYFVYYLSKPNLNYKTFNTDLKNSAKTFGKSNF